MATPESYLAAVRERLAADGCAVSEENWNGSRVLIGRRSDFRLRWMATKLHLFTVVTIVPTVYAAGIQAFSTHAVDYVKRGVLRGMQTGVGVFPAMISTQVDPAANAWAAEKQRTDFACMGRPVVVDTARGTVSCFRGTATLGLVYSGHLRRKLDAYFPQPLA